MVEDVKRILPTVLYMETVGDYLGVSRATWRVWLRRGRKEHNRLAKNPKSNPKKSEALYLEFFSTCKKAIAEGEINAIGIITKAAAGTAEVAGQWQAAAWKLERGFYQRWGRKERQEITGKHGGPIAANVNIWEALAKEIPAEDVPDEVEERIEREEQSHE